VSKTLMAPVLWMSGALLLTHPLYCQDVKTYRYTVGVPVQSGQLAELLPRSLSVVSQYPLAVDSQTHLVQQYIVAAQAALVYAKEEELNLQRMQMPARVVMCNSPEALADMIGLPATQYGGQVVARVDLRWGTVYLGRRDPSDLYVELGKWFFYEAEMRWGENRVEDMRRLRMAERFALVCQQEVVGLAAR
jgi:hypothetical protein